MWNLYSITTNQAAIAALFRVNRYVGTSRRCRACSRIIRHRWSETPTPEADIVVIADDVGKEPLLEAVAALLPAETKLLIGGFSHFAFRDEIFDRVRGELFIPSFANGYQYSLVHIYQCLQNAHRQGLKGVVAEFGMFKGGTTMLISKFIEEMGADWKVFGFDTFNGFPPRRSALDMYAHPDCVFLDVDLVKAVFAGRNVEVVEGDVVQTVSRLQDQDLVLSFADTDNFSSANAIIRHAVARAAGSYP